MWHFLTEEATNGLGPSWHWVTLTVSFVLPNDLVFKNFLLTLKACLWFWSFILSMCQVYKITFLLKLSVLSLTLPIEWPWTRKRPHALSGSPQCQSLCLLCSRPTLLPASSWLQPILPQLMRSCLSPYRHCLSQMVYHCLPLKSFLPLFK